MEAGAALEGDLEPDDGLLSRLDAALGLGRVDGAALAVVALVGALGILLGGAKLGQPLLAAEAVVGLAHVHEPQGVLLVELEALGLDVGSAGAADVGTLVPVEAEPVEGLVEVLDVFLGVARAVGILEPKDEFSAVGAGEEIVDEGGPDAAYVLVPRGGRGVAYSDFHGEGV